MDNIELLYDLLKEVRAEQKNHSIETERQNILLAKIESTLEKNTADIDFHIQRSTLMEERSFKLEEMYQLVLKRIEQLEQPEKAKEWIYSKATKITAILGGIGTLAGVVLKFFGIW